MPPSESDEKAADESISRLSWMASEAHRAWLSSSDEEDDADADDALMI